MENKQKIIITNTHCSIPKRGRKLRTVRGHLGDMDVPFPVLEGRLERLTASSNIDQRGDYYVDEAGRPYSFLNNLALAFDLVTYNERADELEFISQDPKRYVGGSKKGLLLLAAKHEGEPLASIAELPDELTAAITEMAADHLSKHGYFYSEQLEKVVVALDSLAVNVEFNFTLSGDSAWIYLNEATFSKGPSYSWFSIKELIECGVDGIVSTAHQRLRESIGWTPVEIQKERGEMHLYPVKFLFDNLQKVDGSYLDFDRSNHPEYVRDSVKWRINTSKDDILSLVRKLSLGEDNSTLVGRLIDLVALFDEADALGGIYHENAVNKLLVGKS